ncbi:hypothetical protein Ppa06_02450 [Planomonospora parontospora subsp. parontospora]|uniref:Uncharacterized protein n=2 Tax=Planomonospora parontospora TaxID=58119 RepID=A0AA37F253_9ACTN|nr:hypothetical protein GCM10010126_02460 [Planomonospora parontospora]GII06447.1 hypothetical protein Ppa06_02450 [Planomonospora parontospora subsp. parontospora]
MTTWLCQPNSTGAKEATRKNTTSPRIRRAAMSVTHQAARPSLRRPVGTIATGREWVVTTETILVGVDDAVLSAAAALI